MLVLLALACLNSMSQSTNHVAGAWLTRTETTKPFQTPDSLEVWQKQRLEIRSGLTQLLGRLPARPASPQVTVILREDRGDYVLEKFQFDNGAGDLVPGYLLLPKGFTRKVPAILYCHWHGGQYDIGKEELFRTNALPEPAGPALVASRIDQVTKERTIQAIDRSVFDAEIAPVNPYGTAGKPQLIALDAGGAQVVPSTPPASSQCLPPWAGSPSPACSASSPAAIRTSTPGIASSVATR